MVIRDPESGVFKPISEIQDPTILALFQTKLTCKEQKKLWR